MHYKIWIPITIGAMLVLTSTKMTKGLKCNRNSVLKGTPCEKEGEPVGKEACETLAPRCCAYSVGGLHCFVNKNYKENNQGNEVCINNEASLNKQLSIDSSDHDDLFAVGRILSTHHVLSELHCLDYCFRNHLCNVYNYQYNSEKSGKTKSCELLHEVESKGTKHGFRYRTVKHSEMKALLTSTQCKTP